MAFNKLTKSAALLATATMVMPAAAHEGASHAHGSFMAGLLHPLSGVDHLAALLLFGALLAGLLGKEITRSLLAAVVSLSVGFGGGLILGGHVAMEWLIVGSSAVFAALMFVPTSARGKAVLAVASLLVAHGWAHGAEMASDSAPLFMAGFLMASLAIMAAGLPLGRLIADMKPVVRAAVSAMLAAGLMLIAG
ncbi:MAG: urease accessory protein UreJ [Oceanospirillaceae bacterium]|jgi:urease accessory protein|nr:urease accessory protein UreJ [Oceanospirillaceae bacterium]MEC8908148.1 HupE/UreJ family protein [Pseudomonadota bacterium]MED5440569.1 HupE/UreJ family protein [Pseudomonadota bacterium]